MTARTTTIALTFVATAVLAVPALADFQRVDSRDDFVSMMSGKELTRPLVRVAVTADGAISGTGAAWAVTGNWQWENGYLCRSLFWGGDDMGYNCQEVLVDGARVRITSDKGSGQSADFTLR